MKADAFESQRAPEVAMAYVLVPVFSMITGYSAKAIYRKIARGVWREGTHFLRAPDGRIHINVAGYTKWLRED